MVRTHIIHDDNITFMQSGYQHFFKIIDKTISGSSSLIGCVSSFAVQSYGGKYCRVGGSIFRRIVDDTLFSNSTTIMSGHINIYTAFIKKNQFFCIYMRYFGVPILPFRHYIGHASVLSHKVTSFYNGIPFLQHVVSRFRHSHSDAKFH